MHQFIFIVDSTYDQMLLEEAKINYTEFLIMLALEEDINYTQDQIAFWSNFTKSTVSKTIDKLVTKKLLIRKEHNVDRRQKTINFTSKGKQELEVAQKLATKLSNTLFGSLTDNQQKEINIIMDKLNKEGMDKLNKEGMAKMLNLNKKI